MNVMQLPSGERLGVLLNSHAEILFLRERWVGGVLLGVTLIRPGVGLAGLLSVIAAYLFARLIGMGAQFLASGFYTYNALLVGLSIGYLFPLQALTVYLVASAAVLSFVLSVTLANLFGYYLKLPILSLPFVLVSSITWLASQSYDSLYAGALEIHTTTHWLALPAALEGFFTALGAILFVPDPLAGAVVALAIGLCSRILLLLGLGGYLLGALLSGLLSGNGTPLFSDVNYFNFILIAMALGGVLLVPAPRSYLIAAVAVAVATLLLSATQLFWANFGIPVFTLPFNLITLSFLYVLNLIGFPLVASPVRPTPEQTLDDYLSRVRRFAPAQRQLGLPFYGEWTVWQGCDGPWTHQGSWRHAYDFVIGRNGETFRNEGQRLEDYHAWGKPVIAPCRGRIVHTVADLPDNPPGHPDTCHNWGNLVIIETPEGDFIELSHFASNSLKVMVGDWVEAGSILGLCGNSGNSAQPHIHIQRQANAQVGAPTLPFAFHGYVQDERFVAQGEPATGNMLEPLFAERELEQRLALPLESTFHYTLHENGQPQDARTLTVRMDQAGEYYLDSGKARLYFARDRHSFYFYRLEGRDPVLALLFCALPRLPLSYRTHMAWSDSLPLAASVSGWRHHLLTLARAFHHGIGNTNYRAQWMHGFTVEGSLQRPGCDPETLEATLHEQIGIAKIRLGNQALILKENA